MSEAEIVHDSNLLAILEDRRITLNTTRVKIAESALLNLIGPNEPVDGYSKDLNRSVRPAARNEVRDELRSKVRTLRRVAS